MFVIRLELHLQEVPVLLADDLTDESRQSLQVTQQSLQLGLQQGDPLLHVLPSLVQVRHHVVHDVLSLETGREKRSQWRCFRAGVRHHTKEHGIKRGGRLTSNACRDEDTPTSFFKGRENGSGFIPHHALLRQTLNNRPESPVQTEMSIPIVIVWLGNN